MKSTRFEVLSGQEIDEIKQATLEVLEQAGLKVEVKKMRGILADLGCTVDEKTRIVKFPPRVVETYVAKAPREFVLCGHDRSLTWKVSPETRVWGGLGTAVNMYNLQTGAYGPATMEDLTRHLILLDAQQNIQSNQMDIWPSDVPMQMIPVEAIRIWAKNCNKSFGMGAYGVMPTRDMMEMLIIAMGGADKIKDTHPYMTIVNTMSPLSSAQIQVEGLMILAEYGQPAIFSPEAMAGTTAPITLAGLLIQHNAEVLAHIVMAQAIKPGTPVLYGTVSTIAEMRRGTVALGSVETGLISAGIAQIAHSYDIPCRGVAGGTESKLLDLQCGVERVRTMHMAAMGGVNYITCVGTIESTTAAAHELAVIDDELIGSVERAIRGIEVNETTKAVEIIKKVGPAGDYLMQEHTQKYFRTEHFIPSLCDRDKRDIWEKSGKKDMVGRAREKALAILAKHKEKTLDTAVVKGMDDYIEMVGKRTLDEYYAAEWEA
ncbi:MAG: trimethylamine methyltransferase family protein [Deltaproteobacteria bacterium]|nr:trimethylamine methyltransferase family protein [Candidatus Zymogenaceae bacterium]